MKNTASENQQESSSNGRLVGFDAARGILLILGVILHASNIYAISGSWIISDSQRNIFFDILVGLIHQFRMPTFFWIAGYFSAMTFTQKGSTILLKRRIPRLAIPLITCWITLNVLQEGFVSWWGHNDPILAVLDGVPLFHLWFLIDLLFFIILAPIYLPWLRYASSRLQCISALNNPIILAIGLGVFSYFLNLAARSSNLAYDPIFGITTLHRLTIYMPFFLIGAFMHFKSDLKETLLGIHFATLVLLLPLALYTSYNLKGQGIITMEFFDLTSKVLIWSCLGACLNFFITIFRRSTWITRLLADASYTIFLFSHCLIVIMGALMTQMKLPVSIKFFIVVLFSIVASTLIHELIIRRQKIPRLIFNGY